MNVTVAGNANGTDRCAPVSNIIIDGNTLIDCDSSIETLRVEQLLHIHRVLLSHAHFEHCGGLPFLLACHAEYNGPGITLYSQQETIDSLKAHLFNDELCPDYTAITTPAGEALLRFIPVEVGDALPLPDGMATALPAQHKVPAVSWLIEGPWRALAYTCDSTCCPAFWHWAANVPSLSDIICEITYSNEQNEKAHAEGRMTPVMLLPMLDVVPPNVQVWISGLAQEHRNKTLGELRHNAPPAVNVCELRQDTVIDL